MNERAFLTGLAICVLLTIAGRIAHLLRRLFDKPSCYEPHGDWPAIPPGMARMED